jgi:hypothetical protein
VGPFCIENWICFAMLTASFPQLEKSVFVVTYGRSGSTLLQNMLNSLPGYLIRGENENLLAPLAQAWNMVRESEQGSKMRESGRITTPQDPWFGYEGIYEQTFGQALARSFTETVLRPDDDTRVIGFKEIRWHTDPALFPAMLTFLRRFFPDARFIFNIRDHDQVIRSGWWKHMPEHAVRKQLSQAETLYNDFANAHPEQCITMDYNRYVTGTAPWRPLFDFLGEPFDDKVVVAVLENKLQHMHNLASPKTSDVQPPSGMPRD